ncbi:MAG: cell division protein FtsQ/DivIB, partial [Yaniella sp.]|nr:cell division protein FtsQ/DivIB [Yaniella sp.]
LGSLPDDLRDQVRAASGSSIDSIELELTSGKVVMWGNNEDAEKKAKVLEALLGLEDDEAAQISEYDVSAPDFPVTR